jgi:hypothetical protein
VRQAAAGGRRLRRPVSTVVASGRTNQYSRLDALLTYDHLLQLREQDGERRADGAAPGRAARARGLRAPADRPPRGPRRADAPLRRVAHGLHRRREHPAALRRRRRRGQVLPGKSSWPVPTRTTLLTVSGHQNVLMCVFLRRSWCHEEPTGQSSTATGKQCLVTSSRLYVGPLSTRIDAHFC